MQKKRKKVKKKIMKANSSSRVSDLRATDLHISYPSLYQLSYDLMFSFLKLQYTWITTWMNWPLLRVTVAWWQNYRGSCSQNSTKVGGWERMGKRAARKNRAAAQGKFSYGVDRPPLSWLWFKAEVFIKNWKPVRGAPGVHMHKLGIGNDEEIMGKIRLW
jgi:hypothetical protein